MIRKFHLLLFCSVVLLASCTKNNPAGNNAEPSNAEWVGESYLHDKYMDRSVKPGDSFWNFALGEYFKAPDDYAGTMATAMMKQATTMYDIESLKAHGPGTGHTMELILGPTPSPADEKAVLTAVLAELNDGTTKADVMRNIGKLADLGYYALLGHDVWYFDGILRYTVIPGFSCENNSGTKDVDKIAELIRPVLRDQLGINTDSDEGTQLLLRVAQIDEWIGQYKYEWKVPITPDPVVVPAADDELTQAYREAFHVDGNTYQLPAVSKVFEELIDRYDVTALQTYLKFYACNKLGKVMFCTGHDAGTVCQLINAQAQSLFADYHKAMLYQGDKCEMAVKILEDLRTLFAQRIERLDWMSDATKAKAIEKLQAMGMNVKPETTFYTQFQLTGKTPVEDMVQYKRQVDEYLRNTLAGQGRDHEWEYLLTSPNGGALDTANAGYDPNNQLIIFPFFLRDEFFPSDKDRIVTFYATLMVFGHEMTHGFDNNGANYDAVGNKVDWWTPEDKAKFQARQQNIIDRYNELEVLPGVPANGAFTLGENIADLGGFSLAWEMWNNKLKADGVTGEALRYQQRLFLMEVAHLWKQLSDEETLLQNAKTDPHSANHNRVNGIMRLLDEWYDLFDVQPGDKLYVAPSNRTQIW